MWFEDPGGINRVHPSLMSQVILPQLLKSEQLSLVRHGESLRRNGSVKTAAHAACPDDQSASGKQAFLRLPESPGPETTTHGLLASGQINVLPSAGALCLWYSEMAPSPYSLPLTPHFFLQPPPVIPTEGAKRASGGISSSTDLSPPGKTGSVQRTPRPSCARGQLINPFPFSCLPESATRSFGLEWKRFRSRWVFLIYFDHETKIRIQEGHFRSNCLPVCAPSWFIFQ